MQADRVTLAIDIGASRSRLALVDGGAIGERAERATADLAGSDGTITAGLVAAAVSLHKNAGSPGLGAIGIGVAASVSSVGIVLQERDFGIPAGSAIRDSLAATFGVPVLVDNDANLAALAEHGLGAARGEQHAAVITLGTNIGLGLILGGRIYRGARGAAGEIGLLLVPAANDPREREESRLVDAGSFGRAISRAPAGYAWIEELVGGGALATAAGGAHPRVFAPAALAEPSIRRLSENAIEGWAMAIADLAVMLDPGVVVLTGGVATDAAPLLNVLQRRVAELAGFRVEIRLGSLGPDAELLGADLLARASLEGGTADSDAGAGLSAHIAGGWR
jgi:glucokinase